MSQLTRPPTISNRRIENPTNKINVDDLTNHLHEEIQRRLERKIQNCIEENDDVEVLKRECASMKQLERGAVANVE
ncbi:hypothetical protein BDF21DRAFT_32431 [Thamnidium elegans]|nr:hypothetical protein BDF21DRAFT_32431 [Thamnidium elegans]